jgi:hypothetical protein
MLSFSVFRKLQPRRPFTPLVPSLEGSFEGPLFSFVAEVSVEDPDLVGTQLGSPSLTPAGEHIRPSRHAQAREKKQLLLSSSKTRPYKSPPHRDARKSFRIRSYENCRVSPTISRPFSFLRSLHDRNQPFLAPFFSYSCKLPILQFLCFDILACNGGVEGVLRFFGVGTFTRSNDSFDLSPLFSYASALFGTTGITYLLFVQSLAHSFACNGGYGGGRLPLRILCAPCVSALSFSDLPFLPALANATTLYSTFNCRPLRATLQRVTEHLSLPSLASQCYHLEGT